jgi:hypothetical protein
VVTALELRLRRVHVSSKVASGKRPCPNFTYRFGRELHKVVTAQEVFNLTEQMICVSDESKRHPNIELLLVYITQQWLSRFPADGIAGGISVCQGVRLKL